MGQPSYREFFAVATGGREPYPYQTQLAQEFQRSLLIDVSTGLGKTYAVVLAWIWQRFFQPDVELRNNTPRRLLYCLPTRTLVRQTYNRISEALVRLRDAYAIDQCPACSELAWLAEHSPVILMGGLAPEERNKSWDIYPEKPCILVGTQDQLISRALNRGYTCGRKRWPIHFALLNNDCLWVLDETQLMGVAVETSAQLAGFRAGPELGSTNTATWWMSATLASQQLDTPDHPQPATGWPKLTLSQEDLAISRVANCVHAYKLIQRCSFNLSEATKATYASTLADFIVARHQTGTLTLVIVNRPQRAQTIYSWLQRKLRQKKQKTPTALIHSKFRQPERSVPEKVLLEQSGDRIVICTQVVEAGVDVSARLMITELAPWSSMVQRFGRCNRQGEFSDADIYWIDIDWSNDTRLAIPYDQDDLNLARSALAGLSGASPAILRQIHVPVSSIDRPVIARQDLVESLFDTAPDLSGEDPDIRRYVRDPDDGNVEVLWRNLPTGSPSSEASEAQSQELCRVSLSQLEKFLELTGAPMWRWNWEEDIWQADARIMPESVYLLDTSAGGYSRILGWTGNPKHIPESLELPVPTQRNKADASSFNSTWMTLSDHTRRVKYALLQILSTLGLNANETLLNALCTAVLWHDVGKVHETFQLMLTASAPSRRNGEVWAKSGASDPGEKSGRAYTQRRGFRHELASALVWLVRTSQDTTERALIAFLICCHHGHNRMSIRPRPSDPVGSGLVCGVKNGETLPGVTIKWIDTPALVVSQTQLDLNCKTIHGGANQFSWPEQMAQLRDRVGIFRLALLEAIIRAADARGS